jgi:DNA polymerase-3 subunit delta
MDVTPEQLVAQLDTGPLQPAYLIAGAEPLLVLEAADAVRMAARRHGVGEREVFEAGAGQREPDWDGLVASFNAPGLFAARRLVEVRLPSGKPGKEGAAAIVDYCARPSPDVVLLVTAEDWSRQHGGAWSEAIGRIGRVAVAWPVKMHELPGWVERRLRSRGFSPDRDASPSGWKATCSRRRRKSTSWCCSCRMPRSTGRPEPPARAVGVPWMRRRCSRWSPTRRATTSSGWSMPR